MTQEAKKTYRDLSIDVLRWVALTGIILVHIQPTAFWSQLRSFDVPMMVFLSAYCFTMGAASIQSYKSYYIKRFKRLILPCWFFLAAWFILYYNVSDKPIDWINIGMCFSLLTSWYVWIIRIFALMAILAPFVTNRICKLSPWQFFTIWIIGLVVNELLANASESYLYEVVIMTFSYLLIFALGVYITRLSNKQIFTIWGVVCSSSQL